MVQGEFLLVSGARGWDGLRVRTDMAMQGSEVFLTIWKGEIELYNLQQWASITKFVQYSILGQPDAVRSLPDWIDRLVAI